VSDSAVARWFSAPASQGITGRITAVCLLVFDFRLIVLLITVFSLADSSGTTPLIGALTAAAAASFLPLKFWRSFGPKLLRHPVFLAGDLLLTMTILTITGPESPFFYFTLSTSLLSGLLYGWVGAAVFSPLMLACYWLALSMRSSVAPAPDGFQVAFGWPALYPLTAVAGGAVRRLLDEQSRTEAALSASARIAAIERERARIAREMHDSLAKTIHGIGLQATSLARWIEKDPRRASDDARAIAAAARDAAAQARGLIRDLRLDSADVSLHSAVHAIVEQWSDASGISADTDNKDVECACPERRWELISILREALHNVERHAGANKVSVTLAEDNGTVVLRVADDGRGFERADDESLARGGHFGLIGMKERAERVGGRLDVTSSVGAGTAVVATVPLSSQTDAGEGDERDSSAHR